MRADAQTGKHIMEISRHLIEVAVEQRNWIAVTSNVQKIKGVMDSKDLDKSLQPFLCASEGLASLDGGEYYNAALQFLQTDSGIGTSCNTIISANDIAVYGGLCALATMERNDLNKRVLENSNFRTYLELEPHIRRAIGFFVNSRYSQCLTVLESYRADYLLDIHLSKHVDELYYMIRSKSIVQYFIPFSCITLDSLNEAFAAPGKTIDKELALMIKNQELEARIDTQNRVFPYYPSTISKLTRVAPHLRPRCTTSHPPSLNPPNSQGIRARSSTPNPTHEHPRRRSRDQGQEERQSSTWHGRVLRRWYWRSGTAVW